MLAAEFPTAFREAGVSAAITDVGIALVAIAGAVTALGVLTRLRPVKWLWCQLVTDPLGGWFTHMVTTTVKPLRDEIAEVKTETLGHMRGEERDRKQIIDQLHVISDQATQVQRALDRHLPEAANRDRRIERIEAFLQLDDGEAE